ncbi:MAG: glutathione S-transferase family protein [Polyangiaceae bacterium]|nr:glutathione S-transferase family protein [Polyangiaceae bacterium]
MSIVLYHHPFSRAATVIWMLEEVGIPYELKFVDMFKGEHKTPEITALNAMGKLPILTDGEAVVTEVAAIGLYLADRYSMGKLAPSPEDPARATYLRWSLFAPSVIEPGSMAKAAGWEYKPGQAGWGDYNAMLTAMEGALTGHDYIVGNNFTMADAIFGGTLRYMMMFKMIEPRPVFSAYVERLNARPALQRSDAKNAEIAASHGLKRG